MTVSEAQSRLCRFCKVFFFFVPVISVCQHSLYIYLKLNCNFDVASKSLSSKS